MQRTNLAADAEHMERNHVSTTDVPEAEPVESTRRSRNRVETADLPVAMESTQFSRSRVETADVPGAEPVESTRRLQNRVDTADVPEAEPVESTRRSRNRVETADLPVAMESTRFSRSLPGAEPVNTARGGSIARETVSASRKHNSSFVIDHPLFDADNATSNIAAAHFRSDATPSIDGEINSGPSGAYRSPPSSNPADIGSDNPQSDAPSAGALRTPIDQSSNVGAHMQLPRDDTVEDEMSADYDMSNTQVDSLSEDFAGGEANSRSGEAVDPTQANSNADPSRTSAMVAGPIDLSGSARLNTDVPTYEFGPRSRVNHRFVFVFSNARVINVHTLCCKNKNSLM